MKKHRKHSAQPSARPEAAVAIDCLSDRQIADLEEFIRRWRSLDTSSQLPAEALEKAIARAYEQNELKPPILVICDSPWQAICMHAMLRLLASPHGSELKRRLSEELKEPLWQAMWRKLEHHLDKGLSALLETAPPDRLDDGAAFGPDVTSSLTNSVATALAKAEGAIAGQLGVRAKLRLRDRLHVDFSTRQRTLLRGQFVLGLPALIPVNPAAEFLAQLSPDTRQIIIDWCEREDRESRQEFFGRAANESDQLSPAHSLFTLWKSNATLLGNTARGVPFNLHLFGFIICHLPVKIDDSLKQMTADWLSIKHNLFDLHCFQNVCFAVRMPVVANVDERFGLHCVDGPAVEFADGFKIYAFNGVRIPANVVERPQSVKLEEIDKEANVEVRRIMIQRYGLSRYLEDSGAVQIDADDCGVLYKKALAHDEPIVVVKVTNPTPEPDGTHKEYFLRVPPYISTARAAVAWTFDMKSDDYEPIVQS